jgi:uncharacterized protein (DUF885 family)
MSEAAYPLRYNAPLLDRRSLLLASVSLAACASPPPQALNDFGADATFHDLVERLGDEPPNGETLEAVAARRSAAEQRFAAIRAVNPMRLAPADAILRASIFAGAQAEADLARTIDYGSERSPYVVTHRAGAYRRINAALDRPDADAGALALDLIGETERIETDAARGIIPPTLILERTLAELDALRARFMLVRNATAAALGPPLSRQIEALHLLRPRATEEAGVWRLPHGDLFYARLLQAYLGAPVTPRAAHQQALARAQTLRTETDALLRAQNLTEGSVGERLRALTRDTRYLYADNNAGKSSAVAEMNARLARIRTLLPRAFSGLETTPAEVRRMSAADEARGAGGRRDDAAYIVDLTHIRARPSWTLPSVVHHETLPGHLLQAPLQAAAAPPRLQMRFAGGYAEGWAIYAEQLADELGAFEDDPLGRIGYLQWMLFRMARVVVDTGIHVMRWSRVRAIDEMLALQGDSIAFVTIEDDVDRICAEPAAFTAQGLAALYLVAQRERARRTHGARFDLARFHDAALKHGPLSPPGLAEAVRVEFALER